MNLTFFHFALYIGFTWGTNIAFNLLYVLKTRLSSLARYDVPVDGGILLRDGRRLLGDSTTLPGLGVALVCSYAISCTSYAMLYAIPLLVYLGHLVGSFIKRRMGKGDGQFVIGIDHGDYMVMTGIVLGGIGIISWQLALAGILFTYIVHPIATLVTFRLGLRKYPY